MNCQTPKNSLEVIYFMGLAGYYHRFIEGFSNISHMVTYLQNKVIKFDWTFKCETSFSEA